jgi:hypothetical protein
MLMHPKKSMKAKEKKSYKKQSNINRRAKQNAAI